MICFLKSILFALIKRQWGANLIKFEGMQMPGGVTLNGRQIYDDAITDIEKIEETMQLTYEAPTDFLCWIIYYAKKCILFARYVKRADTL